MIADDERREAYRVSGRVGRAAKAALMVAAVSSSLAGQGISDAVRNRALEGLLAP